MSFDRSTIRVPLTSSERLVELLACVLISGAFFGVLLNYAALPSRVPIHFNAAGQPNGWGPKPLIWLLPCSGIVLFFIFAAASRISLRWYNIPFRVTADNALRQYVLARRLVVVLNLLTAAIVAALTLASVATARGQASPLGAWALYAILAMFMLTILVYFLTALSAR